jgi:hypothetical protein
VTAPPPSTLVGAPERARAEAVGRAGVALTGIGAALLAGRAAGLHLPACPFRTLTGVPCPGCGTTRLAEAVAHGRVGDALGADPIGVVLLGAIAAIAVVGGLALARGRTPTLRLASWAVLGALGALAVVRWAAMVHGGVPAL